MDLNIDDPLYTVTEVAAIFKVSAYHVRTDWIATGKLKATKIGNRWRIPKSELTRFANERYGDHSGR